MKERRVVGWSAIEVAKLSGLNLRKYADPIEPERDDLSVEDAIAIAQEDPSLIYQLVEFLGWSGPSDGEGMSEEYYWNGDDFLGPDDEGNYPVYGYGN